MTTGGKRVIRWSFALAVLIVVVWAVSRQIDRTDLRGLRPHWPWVAAAGLTLPGMYLCIALSERLLLRSFTGQWLTWRQLLPAAWVPLAGKYVPGKVAAAGTAVVLLKRLGVPATTAVGVFVLLDAMPVLTGSLLGAALLLDDAVRQSVPAAPFVFAGVLVGGTLCLSPPVFRWITTTVLRLMRRPPLPRVPRWSDYAGPLACSIGQWVFNGLSMWCVLRSFDATLTASSLPYVTCATALTMCISYFGAFVTPSGLGVREGTLIALLSPVVGVPAATATAVVMRLNHTLVEAMLCGVGLLMMRGRS